MHPDICLLSKDTAILCQKTLYLQVDDLSHCLQNKTLISSSLNITLKAKVDKCNCFYAPTYLPCQQTLYLQVAVIAFKTKHT